VAEGSKALILKIKTLTKCRGFESLLVRFNFLNSSVVERTAVNRLVVGSNPTLGDDPPKKGYQIIPTTRDLLEKDKILLFNEI
jgi:hypothetical protein